MPRPGPRARSRTIGFAVLAVALAVSAAAFVAAAAPTRPASAQPPTPEPWHLEPIARYGGATHAVAGAGDVLYAGLGARVVALDVSNPTAPVQLGESPVLGGVVQDLVLEGELLYVAWQAGTPRAGRGGLAVVAVADPARMALLRQVPVDVAVRRLAVVDGVALLVGSYGWQAHANVPRGAVLPVDPRPVGAAELGQRHVFEHGTVAIGVAGEAAYVLESRASFMDIAAIRAMDAQDPMQPRPDTLLSVPGPPKALALAASRMYVASGGSGLHVVGIEPEGRLRDLGRASADGACADDVAVSGMGLVSLDACTGRVTVFGLAGDGWPVALGEVVVPPSASRVAWLGTRVAVALGARGGVMLLDGRGPDAVAERGRWTPEAPLGAVTLVALHADEQGLTVAGPRAGLSTLRLPGAGQPPRFAAHLDVDGIEDLAMIGRHVVTTDDAASRLDVIDVGNLAEPRLAGRLALPQAIDVVAHPNAAIAYVPSHAHGLRAISLADPTNPTIAATLPDIEASMVVRGAGGLVALGSLKLTILDIADAVAPAIVGEMDWFGFGFARAQAAVASEHRAYIASIVMACAGMSDCSTLDVIDLSDPARPRSATSHQRRDEPEPHALVLAGELLMHGGAHGLSVLDASALDTAYAPLASYAAPGLVMDVAVAPGEGDARMVAAAEADAGLGIYRLVRTLAPTPTQTVAVPLPTPRPAAPATATPAERGQARIYLPFAARQAVGPNRLGTLDLTYASLGPTHGVAIGDGVVYRGHGGSIAVIALDGEPREVARTPGLVGLVFDLVVDGELLFAAVSEAGLAVYSLTDPRRPVLLGTAATGDAARGVAVAGGLAFVAAGDAGLEVFDVADTSRPRRLGGAAVEGRAWRVWLERGHAFVATMDYTPIQVFDVANPAQPRRVAQLGEDGDGGLALAVHQDYAYVATCSNCLAIFDIADPAVPKPAEGAFLADDVYVNDLVVGEGHLIVLSGWSVEAFDLADPLAPTLMSAVPLERGGRRIAVRGAVVAATTDEGPDNAEDFGFLVDPGSLELVDATDLGQLRYVGSVWPAFMAAQTLLPSPDPDTLYVVESTWARAPEPPGQQIHAFLLDLADPDMPRRGARVPELDDVSALVVEGTTGFAIYGRRSLAVLEMSTPAKPTALSSLDLGTGLTALSVAGDTALIQEVAHARNAGDWVYTTTLHLVDVGDTARPVRAASIVVPGIGGASALSGTTAWLSVPGGIRAVDVADPWRPIEVGRLALPGLGDVHAPALMVTDGMRVWAASNRGLFAIDGSDPSQPRLLGTTEGEFDGFWPVGRDRLLLSGCGLTLFHLPASGAPVPIGRLDRLPYIPLGCDMEVLSIVSASGRLYGVPWFTSISGNGGMLVVDLANPPTSRARFNVH